MELELITNPNAYPKIIHGTYLSRWIKIKTIGLSKMKRNYIYFTIDEPKNGKIDGLIRPSEIFIYIDLPRAMKGTERSKVIKLSLRDFFQMGYSFFCV